MLRGQDYISIRWISYGFNTIAHTMKRAMVEGLVKGNRDV
jgi:hypothetical protein